MLQIHSTECEPRGCFGIVPQCHFLTVPPGSNGTPEGSHGKAFHRLRRLRKSCTFPHPHGDAIKYETYPPPPLSNASYTTQTLAEPPPPPPPFFIQVLHSTWSVIVATCPEDVSITVAPFHGVQSPPYWGEPHMDSRNLCFDPRGWWNHAPALKICARAEPGRLYRPPRGLAASGLPWGAGSLNEPLQMSGADLEGDPPPCGGEGIFALDHVRFYDSFT